MKTGTQISLLMGLFLILDCSPRLVSAKAESEHSKPNILWITSEDNGPQLGCYGDGYADTPNLDALAARGMLYANAWSNAPVCAPARTTIISGMYPTTLGAQHMRSAVRIPHQVKLLPQLMREQGYYCSNNVKTDYNLLVDEKAIWNECSKKASWKGRKADQPFFAVFNLNITHESQIRTRPHQPRHDPAKVDVPPYHPNVLEVRQDWGQYYDKISEMDRQVGDILSELKSDGLADTTIVFYFGDHGSGMPRCKRWLYEGGLRVPLIVHIPQKFKSSLGGDYQQGTTSQRLVSFVDLVPTMLSLAGVRTPDYLQGSAFLGSFPTTGPQYLFGFRDRMDERIDMSRAVRDGQFSYIRNFMPHRPQGTFLEYMFQTPTTTVWKKLFDEGKLSEVQSQFWQTKPEEELYDVSADPHQVRNLAGEPEHTATLQRMRAVLHDWMIRTSDLGLLPEGEIWSRAAKSCPVDMAQNSQDFPVREILEVAEWSSMAGGSDLKLRRAYGNSIDSACRYWYANGLLMRAVLNRNREECVQEARKLSNDPSPYVRCLASETLARFGSDADRTSATEALLRIADQRTDGYFAALTALNCLDWCLTSKKQVAQSLDEVPEFSNVLSDRYKSYIPRLINRLVQAAP